MEDMCAPAAMSVRDTLYLFQSTFEQRPILFSNEPEKGKLQFYNRWLPRLPQYIGPWDPALFYDEDLDKWYMYWGSSNVYPLFGAELDKSKNLTYKSKYQGLIYLDPKNHGWERFGRDHRDTIRPFTEGAWMTKHGGKYFLQYGAPGTEYNVYANGTYIGDNPLGPFTYAPYNPISYKPGGFMTGAGHGNTFQDNYGNYWNTGTPWVAVNWAMERRIVMFPAGFDADNQMFANTRFGDFPQKLPTKKWNNKDELFTGWMLLSYKKPCTASSVRDTLTAQKVTDENPRTFWVANTNKEGESLTIDLQNNYDVKALQVNFTDYKSDVYNSNEPRVYTQFKFYASVDGKKWDLILDNTNEPHRDRPNAYVELPTSIKARHIKYENVHVPMRNLAVSDIRVFGNGSGKSPEIPKKLTVKRQADTRNADISWEKSVNVVGYNILWGIAPDKLYQTYQVWGDAPNDLELRALTVGQKYYCVIEAFNENGVSDRSEVLSF